LAYQRFQDFCRRVISIEMGTRLARNTRSQGKFLCSAFRFSPAILGSGGLKRKANPLWAGQQAALIG
jgi:hypothetical protein